MYEDKETSRKRRRMRRKRKSRRKSRRKSKRSIGRGVVIRKGMITYYMSTLPPRTFKLKS